jgi:D-beta-D-heptose 7-phosphate kinase/D-beta-D-heptose 1-phosphate adenosyltransferase
MSANDLLQVLEGLGRPRLLVLGDLILDRYTWGNAERISQEAPVVVLRADRREARLGGAANVANMLRGLESQVTCCGVVGADAAGDELRQLLVDSGVKCELVLRDDSRPTSVKERFIGRASSRHPSQILRVDVEKCDPLCGTLEARLVEKIAAEMPRHDALLISDYGKGVCTPWLLRATIDLAKRAGVPVMVDPSRGSSMSNYHGVTVIKPNRLEAEIATGRKIAATPDALAAGRQLCHDLAAEMALVTLDRDGMMLVKHDGTGEIFSTRARAVYDITGAGDMVMAMIGLCLAAGADPADAVRLGNVAAGLEVERAGATVILRDEIRAELLAGRGTAAQKVISCEHAARLAEEYRRRGERIVFANGCFDLLHVGHVAHLSEAAMHGNVLFVGINSDASVRRLKGPERPVVCQRDRAAMLAALACVQHVVIFDEDTPHALLRAIRPDVLVKGGAYAADEIVGREVVEAYGGVVRLTGQIDGVSTTHIVASIHERTPDAQTRPMAQPAKPTEPSADREARRRAG